MCAGGPCRTKSSVSASKTSSACSRRATRIARHSRLYSSNTVSIFNGRPSSVRSATKSYAQTWCRYKGRSRIQEPSANHRRPRLGCFFGTFNPSCLQIRSTRLWFTPQPSMRSMSVTRVGSRSGRIDSRVARYHLGAPPRHSPLSSPGAGSCVAARAPGTLSSPTPRAADVHAPHNVVGARGSEVSLGRFLQDQLVQCQVRHCSLQAPVLALELLQAPCPWLTLIPPYSRLHR